MSLQPQTPENYEQHSSLLPLHSSKLPLPPPSSLTAHEKIRSSPVQSLWKSTLSSMRQQKVLPESDLNQIESDIVYGVSLRLVSEPPSRDLPNTPAVVQHGPLVASRIEDYIKFGAVELIDSDSSSSQTPPHGTQPLHVVLKAGKKPRLVIDLSRNLNELLPERHFSYSTVDDAVDLSSKNCWFGKLDLSNCFLTFPLHPNAVKYFYFRFRNNLYRFTGMPFGLRTAPLVCTLLLSVPAFLMKQKGCRFVRYLDDFLLIADSYEQLQSHLETAQQIFSSSGMIVNPEKTEGPVQIITFLGIEINSRQQTLTCPISRVQELKDILSAFTTKLVTSRKSLESLIGKLSFAAKVLPGARPFMRSMIDNLHHHKKRSLPIKLTSSFKQDVQFWLDNINNWNGKQIWRSTKNDPIVFASDASLEGFGFHLLSSPQHSPLNNLTHPLSVGSGFYGSYHPSHSHLHSTHKQISFCEMLAVLAAAITYSPFLNNQNVVFLVDNNTDVAIINKQSTKSDLLKQLLRQLFQLSVKYNFNLCAQHIPGSKNVIADFLSRPTLHKNDPLTHFSTLAVLPSLSLCRYPTLSLSCLHVVYSVCSSKFLPLHYQI